MNFQQRVEPSRSDVRGFVHKRIGRAVGGAVTGFIKGGPVGAITGGAGAFIGGGAPVGVTACPPGFNPGPGGCVAAVAKVPGVRGFLERVVPGGATGFQVTAPTLSPFAMRIQRERAARAARGETAILRPELLPGLPILPTDGTGVAVGAATLGRFGAAVEPSVRMQDIRECPRGMVLAVDSLCYSRRDVRNSERFWPRGRRPLLTGGEMRAISTAASAARKLQRKQKDLMALGLLPKPTARRKTAAVAGHKATLTHA